MISGPDKMWCSFVCIRDPLEDFHSGLKVKQEMKISDWRKGREELRDK